MAYYNWGEQIGNSFMTMLAANKQQKLEEKRNEFEQQRINMTQQQLELTKRQTESSLATDKLQQTAFEQQIDNANRENAMWAGIGNRWVDLNGDREQQGNELIDPKFYDQVSQRGYEEYTLPVWNKATNSFDNTTKYMPRSEYANWFNNNEAYNNSMFGLYKQQQDNLNEQARIAQGNVANNIARQQYEQGQYSLLNQALMQSMPDLNSMFYVDGNGKLVTRPGQETSVSEFYTDALRKYDSMDKRDIEYNTKSTLLGAAAAAKVKAAERLVYQTDAARAAREANAQKKVTRFNSPTVDIKVLQASSDTHKVLYDDEGLAYIKNGDGRKYITSGSQYTTKAAKK